MHQHENALGSEENAYLYEQSSFLYLLGLLVAWKFHGGGGQVSRAVQLRHSHTIPTPICNFPPHHPHDLFYFTTVVDQSTGHLL